MLALTTRMLAVERGGAGSGAGAGAGAGGGGGGGGGADGRATCAWDGCTELLKAGWKGKYCYAHTKERKLNWPFCEECNANKVDPNSKYKKCYECSCAKRRRY
jgi:hypothetical protein